MRSSPIGNTNLQIQAENMQAAESRISDADVATETTEFTCWAPLVSIARDTDVESLAKGVHVDLLPQSTALVDAVPELVRRAIGNVLRNAVHHTPGGRTVRVPLTAREGEDGPEALATVHDGGPGVPEEEPGRLFQPFHRLDSSRGHGTGTDLGLSIALRAIRLHGGAITAANAPRGRLRMEISLPLARWGNLPHPLFHCAAPGIRVGLGLRPAGAPPANANRPGPPPCNPWNCCSPPSPWPWTPLPWPWPPGSACAA